MGRLARGQPRRLELSEQHTVADAVLEARERATSPREFAGAVAGVALDRFDRFEPSRAGERSPERAAEIAAELDRQRGQELSRSRGFDAGREQDR